MTVGEPLVWSKETREVVQEEQESETVSISESIDGIEVRTLLVRVERKIRRVRVDVDTKAML